MCVCVGVGVGVRVSAYVFVFQRRNQLICILMCLCSSSWYLSLFVSFLVCVSFCLRERWRGSTNFCCKLDFVRLVYLKVFDGLQNLCKSCEEGRRVEIGEIMKKPC